MRYANAASFRQAVEEKLRQKEQKRNVSRVRKMIAFERLVMRLSDRWVLKGGYALQLRTASARTTRDIDLLIKNIAPQEIYQALRQELHQDRDDYFTFDVIPTDQDDDFMPALRFRVTANLDGRPFERFHIDIGYQDALSDELEFIQPPDFLAFAGVATHPIQCYSAYQHLAEKIHAIVVTRPNLSSRVKDMVDILIFASLGEPWEFGRMQTVLQAVFTDRNTSLPDQFDHIPSHWGVRYRSFVEEMAIPFTDFDEAVQKVNDFINPVLSGEGQAVWHPDQWVWVSDEKFP